MILSVKGKDICEGKTSACAISATGKRSQRCEPAVAGWLWLGNALFRAVGVERLHKTLTPMMQALLALVE